jgi:hypothetical protein
MLFPNRIREFLETSAAFLLLRGEGSVHDNPSSQRETEYSCGNISFVTCVPSISDEATEVRGI